ncbi:MAG TPA: Gfo/Idh/MocA family oxidoreductase [Chloroflexota bacterium]|nr:Gfo/Idh/MocA family oxidoreductase [Chloroflexota bacterium]
MSVRLGFIGAGGIAGLHFTNFQQIPAAQVVAVFDVDLDASERAATRFPGCRVYPSASALIGDAPIDALYVCVPPYAHEDFESRASERGVALFVEKPIGLELGAARRAASVVESSGILNAAGYHWRYSPLVERARESLAGQTIAMAEGVWLGGLPGSRWWRTLRLSGGQVVEQTTHMVDLLRYFLGEVEEVYASGSSGLYPEVEGYDITDASSATLRFQSGAVGTILSSDLVPGYDVYAKLFARDRTVEIRSSSLKIVEASHVEEFAWRPQPSMHFVEDVAFIRAVETGDRSLIRSTVPDGLRTLEVSLAINRSIGSHDLVRLPLE